MANTNLLGISDSMKTRNEGFARRSTLVTMVVIVVAIAIMATQLPKAFSDDLSRIGRGTQTAVLIHNKNGVESLKLMSVIDDVRHEFADRIEFLIADVETDQGKSFMRQQQLGDIALVLFAADGTRVSVVDPGLDERQLRAALAGFVAAHR
jgi:hypothetical protein